MSISLKKQDLPPAGGYAPIVTKRIPPKSFFNGFAIFGLYLGVTSVSLCLYGWNYYLRKKEKIEMRSSRLAILPLLVAERDRAFLKQLRLNREYERDLMKNVEGWEVGTLYGEPLYKTLPEDSVHVPIDAEYYVHIHQKIIADKFSENPEKVYSFRCYATEFYCFAMDPKKYSEIEMCLREKIMNEVINEFLENQRRDLEAENREWENALKSQAQKQRDQLNRLKNQYPLYDSRATSLYAEKYGTKKIHCFRKCTKFSKPIYEQFDGPFKPE